MPKKKADINLKQGLRLSKVRKSRNITQERLAELSDYSVQTISGIENGSRRMTLESATIFSKVLNIRKEYLMCEDDFETVSKIFISKYKKDCKLRDAFHTLMTSCGYSFNTSVFHYELDGKIVDDTILVDLPMAWEENYVPYEKIIDECKFTTPNGEIKIKSNSYEKIQEGIDAIENELLDYLEFKLQKLAEEGESYETS